MEPTTSFGLISCIFSHVKPSRSSTPGPKFSIMMSDFFSRSTKTCLPSGVFMLTVIERLLQFNIVKYRLSAFGTSRSCPRVASPTGGSNLITSAPIHASSCEQVGPACTWVMSRIFTPFNASIVASFWVPVFGNDTRLFLLGAGVQRRDAAALRAAAFVDDGVDERGTPGAD